QEKCQNYASKFYV
ncbi:Anaerobic regulatory protein, partial [Haemophilus influenzae]